MSFSIVSVQYQDSSNQGVLVTLADGNLQGARVRPAGDARANKLWKSVQEWVAAGNTISAAPPPPSFEPTELAIIVEALTSGANPLINQGQLTAARNLLRSQGP